MHTLQRLLLTSSTEGLTPQKIRKLIRDKTLISLKRGCYIDRKSFEELTSREQYMMKAVSYAHTYPKHSFSHTTAAAFWGIKSYDQYHTSNLIHLKSNVRKTSTQHVKFHLDSVFIHKKKLDGLLISSVAETILDCAAFLPFHKALVLADSALYQGLCAKSDLETHLQKLPAVQGKSKMRKIIHESTELCESPGETLCRIALAKAGFTSPILQQEVHTPYGTFRPDFLFPDKKLIVEFDGDVKYSGKYGTSVSVFKAEQRRHDSLHDIGYKIVRFDWKEIHDPLKVVEKLQGYFPETRSRITDANKYFKTPFEYL